MAANPLKEPYFTVRNIDRKARVMLARLKESRERHPFNLVPSRSALLAIDMQSVFLEEQSHGYIPSATPIIAKVRRLADLYHALSLPVIVTRHLNSERDAGLMGEWWRELVKEEDELSRVIPELAGAATLLLRKSQYDAFYDTSLDETLKGSGVQQLVITGVMTHLCCETTARSAFVRGFEVLFVVDGTATYNERFHMGTLINLSHGFAVPVLASEVERALHEAFNLNG